jgi:hypothetical protein
MDDNDDDLQLHQDIQDDMKLPGDGTSPAADPDDVTSVVDDTSQLGDDAVDLHEKYDEGFDGAVEANLPGESAVIGYDPTAGGDKKTD